MVCSRHLSSDDDRIREDEMGDVSSGNVGVRNNSFLKPCMAETDWQDFAWGSGWLGSSNEVAYSRTPDRLGPSVKYMENSTKLCCLEITVYRIKYSTVLMYSRTSNQTYSKGLDAVRTVNSNSRTSNSECGLFSKKEIHLYGFSAYPDVLSQITRLSGVLVCWILLALDVRVWVLSDTLLVARGFMKNTDSWLLRALRNELLVSWCSGHLGLHYDG